MSNANFCFVCVVVKKSQDGSSKFAKIISTNNWFNSVKEYILKIPKYNVTPSKLEIYNIIVPNINIPCEILEKIIKRDCKKCELPYKCYEGGGGLDDDNYYFDDIDKLKIYFEKNKLNFQIFSVNVDELYKKIFI